VEYLLIVTDDQGCEGAIVYRILFFPPCDAQRLRIPNAFTPNDDGVNDVFRVVPYEGLEQIGSLTIYDRWGEKVYENQGNVSWDGSIDGKPGPSDVYVYRIDIICDGEPKAVWGDVTLLR
jgi:gliding motility-associated-like protein